MDNQAEYTRFYEETDPKILRSYDINGDIDTGEKLIFTELLRPKKLLDIGCGSGRLFNFFSALKIDFIGIEKSSNRINESEFSDQILNLDLCSPDFMQQITASLEKTDMKNFDTAVFMCCVINGLIGTKEREMGWKNIELLAERSDHLVIHMLNDLAWYEKCDKGFCVKLVANLTYQYLYAKKEIIDLFDQHKLTIVHELVYPNPLSRLEQLKSTYFILKRG